MAIPTYVWQSGSRWYAYAPRKFGACGDTREYAIKAILYERDANHSHERLFFVDQPPPGVTPRPPSR
jgi:hypothetical protein